MVSPKRYNYRVIVCYVLVESKKFFKRTEGTSEVEESMEQLLGLCKRLKVIEGKWIFKRIEKRIPEFEEVTMKLVKLPKRPKVVRNKIFQKEKDVLIVEEVKVN